MPLYKVTMQMTLDEECIQDALQEAREIVLAGHAPISNTFDLKMIKAEEIDATNNN